jgi:UDP-N-acetyl-D-glucosamine dehydrogenase
MESLDFKTRMIELASEINGRMPDFVVQLVADALNDEAKALRGSRILVLGVAYKKDVGDYRESPAIEIIQLLAEKGAEVRYHDPLCPSFVDDGLASLVASPMRSVDLTDFLLAETDVVVVVTDHSAIDYERIADRARLVVDCRGVMSNRGGRARVVGLSGQTTGVADEPVAVGIR